MGSLETLLLTLHVISNLFWIGSIVAVGVVLSAPTASVSERGALGHLVYRRLAAPAFGISFLTGLVKLGLSLNFYFVATHFMHAKLPLALGVIALHHVLGARARRMKQGDAEAGRGLFGLTLGVAILAVGAAWLALAKPF